MIAAGGGAAAVFAPGAPTGLAVTDAVLRAGFVATFTAVVATARPRAWLFAGAVALVAAGATGPGVLAGAGLGMSVGSELTDALSTRARAVRATVDGTRSTPPGGRPRLHRARPPRDAESQLWRRRSVVQALSGVLVAHALLRLTLPRPTRATAAVALLACVPVAASALQRMRRRHRRRVYLCGEALGAALVTVAVAFGLAALQARMSASAAIADASAGIVAARGGDSATAGTRLNQAAAAFAQAHRDVTRWWARPALLVPVLAQHARGLAALTAAGDRVATAGAAAADAAGPSAFHVQDGTIDVRRIGALVPEVDASLVALEDASTELATLSSPWLIGPFDDLISRLGGRIAAADTQARTLDALVHELPGLLGAVQPRHYFLALMTPAELRGGGGVIGNYGELTASGGAITLTRFGRLADLGLSGPGDHRRITGPPEYLSRYARFRPDLFFNNAAASPDFPSDAQVIEQLYPQAGGRPVDGVISVDPIAIAALLRITGPVSVPGWPIPLTADNAAQILLHDEYVALGPTARVDFLSDTTKAVFTRLTHGPLPGAKALIDALAPVVRGKHIQIHSVHPSEQRLFDQVGASGAVPAMSGDYLSVIGQNAGESKIDFYLRRSIAYQAAVDPVAGTVHSMASVTLANLAPGGGEPPYVLGGINAAIPARPGDNRMYLSIYSPLSLVRATIDGRPEPMESQTEFGRFVYSAFVTVPAGKSATLRLDLSGRVPAMAPYRLEISSQPTVVPDQLDIRVSTVVAGTRVGAASPTTYAAPLVANHVVTAPLPRAP